jgi:cephalosporin hydroxylase
MMTDKNLSDEALKDAMTKLSPDSATKMRFEFYGGYIDPTNLFMPVGHLFHFMQEVFGSLNTYRGYRANMNPLDAWIYQEIIHETRPGVIIEIGRQHGGSALMLSDMVMPNQSFYKIISIDLDPKIEFPEDRFNTIFQIQGDSTDSDVVKDVKHHCDNRRVMVIDDCSHTKDNVLANLENYSPLVAEGCYYIVEDTILNHGLKHVNVPPGNDPMTAINEFLGDNDQFQIDRAREKFFLTNNPRGYLLRMPREGRK